jgi:hypothetical protein
MKLNAQVNKIIKHDFTIHIFTGKSLNHIIKSISEIVA